MGLRGACGISHGKKWHVPATPVDAVDALGAGDGFIAAFLRAFYDNGADAAAAAADASGFAAKCCLCLLYTSQRINDLVFAPEAVASTDNPEEDDSVNQEDSEDPLSAQPTEKSENRGTLIIDATCCPADIHYPTDVGLLNHARELVEKMIDLLYPDVYKRQQLVRMYAMQRSKPAETV